MLNQDCVCAHSSQSMRSSHLLEDRFCYGAAHLLYKYLHVCNSFQWRFRVIRLYKCFLEAFIHQVNEQCIRFLIKHSLKQNGNKPIRCDLPTVIRQRKQQLICLKLSLAAADRLKHVCPYSWQIWYMYILCYVLFISLVSRPGARLRGCRAMLIPGQVNYVIRAKQRRWFVRWSIYQWVLVHIGMCGCVNGAWEVSENFKEVVTIATMW